MNQRNVLVVEDDELVAKMVNTFLTRAGFHVTSAQDGQSGLELYRRLRFLVCIVDLSLPLLEGETLIDEIYKIDPSAVIVVQTANDNSQKIIDIMKKGVFDYIVKPIDYRQLPFQIEKAFIQAEKILSKSGKAVSEEIRTQRELEEAKWKLEHDTEFKEHAGGASIFYFLKTYFSQGSGIGVLLSMIKMLFYRPTIENGKYLVNEDLMQLIKENLNVADKTIETFSELDYVITNPLELEKMRLHDFSLLIEKITQEQSPYFSLRSQKVFLDVRREKQKEYSIFVNKNYIEKVFRELILNALKFSTRESTISILLDVGKKDLELTFLNSLYLEEEEEFPPNFSKLVLQPFYRLNNVVHDAYNTLDFGLGLTFVDKILKRHKGSIQISKLDENAGLPKGEKAIRFRATILLPIFLD